MINIGSFVGCRSLSIVLVEVGGFRRLNFHLHCVRGDLGSARRVCASARSL